MNTEPDSLDAILARLAKDVESAVHAMYRRQAGPDTTHVRTERFVREARERIDRAAGGASDAGRPSGPTPGMPSVAVPSVAVPSAPPRAPTGAQPRFTAASAASSVPGASDAVNWSAEEALAVTKCILAWLPMGTPATAKADTRCLPPGRELIPSWGEREMARHAARRVPVQGQ